MMSFEGLLPLLLFCCFLLNYILRRGEEEKEGSTCNIPGILTIGFIKLIPASSLFEPQQCSSTTFAILRYKGAVL